MSLCARFTFDDFILSRGKNSFLDRISNRRHVGQETMADEQKAYAQQVRFEFIRQTDGDETMKFQKVVPSPNTARYPIVPRSANCNRSIHGWASVDLELEKGLLVSIQLWERLRSNFRAREGKDSTIFARFRNKERSSSDSRFGRGRVEIVEER